MGDVDVRKSEKREAEEEVGEGEREVGKGGEGEREVGKVAREKRREKGRCEGEKIRSTKV